MFPLGNEVSEPSGLLNKVFNSTRPYSFPFGKFCVEVLSGIRADQLSRLQDARSRKRAEAAFAFRHGLALSSSPEIRRWSRGSNGA